MRLRPVCEAAALLGMAAFMGTCAVAQVLPPLAEETAEAPMGIALKASHILTRLSVTDPRGELPVFFEAEQLEGTPGESIKASGNVRLKRGDLLMRADHITHVQASNEASASGHVRITRGGDVFAGESLRLRLDSLEGEFAQTTYRFGRTGAGGTAQKIEFLGPNKYRAVGATYTSCTPDNITGATDWALVTDEVELDFDANEGKARHAAVRFMGVPILGAPVLTFPITEARKSGFLPPSFDIDNKSGFEFAQPYYWNIAPNRDATFTPTLSSKRGLGMGVETRYLYAQDQGVWRVSALPNDRVADRNRGLVDLLHQGRLGRATDASSNLSSTQYELRWRRVSDDDYWRDFPRGLPSMTPRLYDSHAAIERQINTRAWGLGPSQTTMYARVQTWQALRDRSASASADTQVTSPYRREPQIGLRSRSTAPLGINWQVEGEFNRFTHEDASKVQGNRVHARVELDRPLAPKGNLAWHLTPKVSLQAVSYQLDRPVTGANTAGSTHLTKIIPSLSLDAGTVLERPVQWWGQALLQTLEPRVQYVYTPYKRQSDLPVFDSTERDFNQYSIFSENAFTGVDRVSDANWINVGVTTRLIEPDTGVEKMRLGVVQKVQLADRRITPNDGPASTQRLSDLLLLGSARIFPHWYTDATFQYNSDGNRVMRSLLGVRYTPGDWRTVNMNYRFNRDSNEQVDLGWQWPVFGRGAQWLSKATPANAAPPVQGCRGTWYSVGRLSYSMRDKRMSDALLGVEYDGGCWITRVVAERVSIGRTDASTRLMFQLELVGLSRLGSSPLNALKDNIPGYRLLRDDQSLIRDIPTSSDFNDE